MTDPIGTAQERELIERLKRFGYYPADESARGHISMYILLCNQAADALQSRIAEVVRLEERVAELWEAIFRVKDRCWEADDANWQHDILSIVVPLTDAKIDEVRAALSLQRRV